MREPAADAGQAGDSMLAELRALWHELPGLIGDRVELLSLELQRAGLALAQIVALLLVINVLALTAWVALWAGVVAALMTYLGLPLLLALLVAVVLNAAAVAWCVARIRRLVTLVRLPATRRHLMPRPAMPVAMPLDQPLADHDRTATGP